MTAGQRAFRAITENLVLATLYVATAKLGQLVAIPPGNVTAVWIPSGLILAALLLRGYQLWPGIFIGAILGNAPSYWQFTPASALFSSLQAALLNGGGDVLSAIVPLWFIKRSRSATALLVSVRGALALAFFGAILGPVLSASLGVIGLLRAGLVSADNALLVFRTWWIGDAAGVLVLTPLLLSLAGVRRARPQSYEVREAVVYVICLGLAIGVALNRFIDAESNVSLFLLLPLALWAVFRLGSIISFASVALSATAVVMAKAFEGGADTALLNLQVIDVQQYVLVLAATVLLVHAVAREREAAQGALQRINVDLDRRVNERTKALREAQSVLEGERERLSSLLETIDAGVVVHDAQARVVFANAKASQLLGLDNGDHAGLPATDTVWHFIDEHRAVMAEEDFPVNRILRSRDVLKDMMLGIVHRSGRVVWVLVSGGPRVGEDGQVREVIISFVDITEINEARDQQRRAATVFNNSVEGVIITDAQANILDVNPAFETITGYARNQVLGRNPSLLKSGRHTDAFYASMWEQLAKDGEWRGEIWNRRADGSEYPEHLTISTVDDSYGNAGGYIGIFSDITELKAYQDKLEQLAHYDSLTGLANRALFKELLEQALKNAGRHGKLLAVLFFDLDQFKSVNDSMGHQVGDELLRSLSERLQSLIRETDVLARISGDEFVLMLQDLESEDVLQMMSERLLTAFQEPFCIADNQLRLTASVGVSLFPRDARDAEKLMQYADVAMYQAKDEGRNTLRYFTEELDANVLENAELGGALALALERDELFLHYQPQVELASGKVVGVEVLLRWKHPTLGMVPPDRFIPIAELRGMMMEIGQFVLLEACRQAVVWLSMGLDFGRLAVNVSGNQLQNMRFLSVLDEILADTGLSPQRLELELTESVLMRRTDTAHAMVKGLRERGVQVSIDDFGTGYSSLSYLSKLPVDKLKVDKQFIRDVLVDESDAALAASIVAMGQALDLDVVAEGIETTEQAEFLLQHDCRLGQGYLYSRPLTPAALEAFLGDR